MNNNLLISLVPALGIMLVASVAVVYWRRLSHLQIKWFFVGAGLWTVAIILKVICALLTNEAVLGFMKERFSYSFLVVGGGLFMGIQSSIFEIGLTVVAVLIWRQLGRDAERAIGIGIGAGAFEAFLLGISALIAILVALAGLPGTEKIREELAVTATVTPLFWLVGPAERIVAILCHASSRALVLLGITNRKPMMVFWGFLIFTLLDGVAGAAHVSGKIGQISIWWIELAILPFALVSITILRWCYMNWGKQDDNRTESQASVEASIS